MERRNPINGRIMLNLLVVLASLSFDSGSARGSVSAVFWPDSLGFGDIPVGATVTRSFWVKNTGTDSLIKTFFNSRMELLPHVFSPSSIQLGPGDSIEVNLSITPMAPGLGVRAHVVFSRLIDGIEFGSVDFIGPEFSYRSVSSGLNWSSPQFHRSLHSQWFVVSGSRVTALKDAQLRIEPDSVTVRKIYADPDSFMVGLDAGPGTPEGLYKLLFTDGINTLDSLHFQVVESWPRVYPPYDDLHFDYQKDLDTLVIRGQDFWPNCSFTFASGNLTVVSADFSADTLVHLTVRLSRRPFTSIDTLRIKNPDNTYLAPIIPINIYADALPLTPESGSPGAQLPRAFSLGANYPNPFNPSTTISYSVAGNAPVRVVLRVFNLRGQTVATLVDRVTAPGEYSVEWDGTDSGGAKLSSGVYFYRMTAGDFSFTRKMVLLK